MVSTINLLGRSFNSFLGMGSPRSINRMASLAPVTGYKKLYMRFNDLNKVELQSASFDTVVPLVARAECRREPGARNHLKNTNGKVSIGRNCTCGYYSFKDVDDAFKYDGRWLNPTVAEVVNSGYYVEHDKGYRAERIRVSRILVRYCGKCAPEHKNPAVTFNLTKENHLVPMCADHNAKYAAHEWRVDQILANFMRPADMTHDFTIESLVPGTRFRGAPKPEATEPEVVNERKSFFTRWLS